MKTKSKQSKGIRVQTRVQAGPINVSINFNSYTDDFGRTSSTTYVNA